MTLASLSPARNLQLTHGHRYGTAPPRWPEIEVEIAATTLSGLMIGQPVRTNVLVDSGADVTMLDESLATRLGIDLTLTPWHWVGGIGSGIPARRSEVFMELCGKWVRVPVDFAVNRSPQLLGREGVFDAMVVTFFHRHSFFFAAAA